MGVELFWWNPEREGLSVDLFNNKYKQRLRLIRFPDATYRIVFKTPFFESFNFARSLAQNIVSKFEKEQFPETISQNDEQRQQKINSPQQFSKETENSQHKKNLNPLNKNSSKPNSDINLHSKHSKSQTPNQSKSSESLLAPFCLERVCSGEDPQNEDFLDTHQFIKASDNYFMPSSDSEDLEEPLLIFKKELSRKSSMNFSSRFNKSFGMIQKSPNTFFKSNLKQAKKYPKSNLDLGKLEQATKPKHQHKLYKNNRSKVTSIRTSNYLNVSNREFFLSNLNKSDKSKENAKIKTPLKESHLNQLQNQKQTSGILSKSVFNYNSDRSFSDKSLTFSEIENKYNILIQNALNVSISQKEFSRMSSRRTNQVDNNLSSSCRTHNLSSKFINQSFRDISKNNQSSKHFKILCSPM